MEFEVIIDEFQLDIGSCHQMEFCQAVPWADMQAVKDHFFPDRIALQVFPRQADIVDHLDHYHLWVMPAGFELEFGLDPQPQKNGQP